MAEIKKAELETTLGKEGRILIPKPIRDAVGLECGGKVKLIVEDGKIIIGSVNQNQNL